MSKSYDVFMESFVNVEVGDDIDPSTDAGREVLLDAARRLYVERIVTKQAEFTWEEFDDDR